MLTQINPKLPMRDKKSTLNYYKQLGFTEIGKVDFPEYLMVKRDNIEIHFLNLKL